MLRTGIYRLSQLNGNFHKDIFGKEKNISIYLYQNLDKIDDPVLRNRYEELILNRFNSDRNVIKRTYKNRFDNFDQFAIRIISEQNFGKNSVMDIAISDGRASSHFLEESIKRLKNLCYTGSDVCITYYLNKKNPNSKYYLITDKDKKIIEITLPPFVWNLIRTEGSLYFINNFLKTIILRKIEKELVMKKYEYIDKIDLIHPEFRNLIEKDKCFQVRNYNLFDEIPEKYNVIRAMNILHQGYFNKDQLLLIFSHIYNGLEINGLLIEGSNENAGSAVDGAIYRRDENGFTIICEPERPSRIKELILEFKH